MEGVQGTNMSVFHISLAVNGSREERRNQVKVAKGAG
jgi:hypothetical protein